MPASKKPRKKYRRIIVRTVDAPLPINFGLSSDMKRDLALTPWLVLDAFKRGDGYEEGAHTLAAAVNLVAVMARRFDASVIASADRALAALHNVMERGKGGKWGMSGQEMKDVGVALDLGDEMRSVSTRRDVRDALTQVYKEAALV